MTITVRDGNGALQSVETLPTKGQSTKVGSLPVTLASNDDLFTALGSLSTSANQTTQTGYLSTLAGAVSGTLVQVGGAVADGATPTSNAVRVSGIDGGGLKRTFLTDASGRLAVNVNGTVPISGSVSVSNLPATQAVTGTFWQTTQPVSLAAIPSLAAGTNLIGQVAGSNGTAILQASDGRVLVGGVVADGSAPTGNSIHVSGIDGGGLKRSFLTDTAGRLNVSVATPYNDSTTVLGAAATFTGTSRDSGAISGGTSGLAYFNSFYYSDQAGTASIEGSWDNSTWTKVATAALVAATPLTLQVPLMFRYHRVKLLNGATLQTVLQISSSYTAS